MRERHRCERIRLCLGGSSLDACVDLRTLYRVRWDYARGKGPESVRKGIISLWLGRVSGEEEVRLKRFAF